MAVTRFSVYRALIPELYVVNCAPLYAGNENLCGVYIGAKTGGKISGKGLNATGISRPRSSEPISVYVSRDDGVSYDLLTTLNDHIVTGRLNSTSLQFGDDISASDLSVSKIEGHFDVSGGPELANMPISTNYEANIAWDNGAEFTPTSCSELRLLNGVNRMLVGDEVVAYKTVTAVSSRLSTDLGAENNSTANIWFHGGFLRGLRGTEGNIQGSTSNTRFWDLCIHIDPVSFPFVPLLLSDVGRTLKFKAASPGMDLDDAVATSIEITGRTLKPFAPTQAWGVRDASNNLTISWTRRARAEIRLLGSQGTPYGEDADKYKVEILSGAAPYTVLRTIDATTTSCTYTAAQHSTDGLTAGGAVNVKIYQWSNAVGWGLSNQMQIPANEGGTSTPTPNYKIPATLS